MPANSYLERDDSFEIPFMRDQLMELRDEWVTKPKRKRAKRAK